MKYFKLHHELWNDEWTEYGAYEDSDITPKGEIKTDCIRVEHENDEYSYDCYEMLFDPEDITEISYEEYKHVVEQLQKVNEIQSQIDEILEGLIKK